MTDNKQSERDGLVEKVRRLTIENGPIVIDQMGEDLAWRPLDYGTWTTLRTPSATAKQLLANAAYPNTDRAESLLDQRLALGANGTITADAALKAVEAAMGCVAADGAEPNARQAHLEQVRASMTKGERECQFERREPDANENPYRRYAHPPTASQDDASADVRALVSKLTAADRDWYVPGESYPVISCAADAWIKEARPLIREALAALSHPSPTIEDAGRLVEELLDLIETAHEHGNEMAIVEKAEEVRAALNPTGES